MREITILLAKAILNRDRFRFDPERHPKDKRVTEMHICMAEMRASVPARN